MLIETAQCGVAIRLCFGDPNAQSVETRDREEGLGGTLAAKIRSSLTYYRALPDLDGCEMRLRSTTLYASLWRYEGMDEDAIWEGLAADVYEAALDNSEDIQAWVDWAGVALPEPAPPVLPEGCVVTIDGREFRYGRNSTLDGCV